ncbi:translation elongation factor Ts [Pantoea sp. Mhis]|uniref:translation elongation factor Ts n=1 Tax=Pantoea sp. Mhis TaxID=2576759 RepID=UPI00135B1576|nr:translation elongation factor Ts [Pantoea sp. Mhis]MXP56349.1 elongation factor Ts [Pantoea sp. Mhis]
MNEITTALVKELRERTGLGIMECKTSLIEVNGNIELAIKNMRKSGIIKAAKKSCNAVVEGLINVQISDGYAMILEVNCETDFVAKHNVFQGFVGDIMHTAITKKLTDINKLKSQFEEERIALISKFGENINIRRIAILEGTELNCYQHSERIGVLISTQGLNKTLSKQIAMHITASKPEFIKPEDVPNYVIKNEYEIQLEITAKSNKPKEIIEKIVAGRMKKFIEEISLISQLFIFDQNKSVMQILEAENASVINFIRFELGEAIETPKLIY